MITLFVGPTISGDEAGGVPHRLCLPPAAQGDVYKAALEGPRVIGIVDGYFQGRLSIWHKEILWAMSRGIHVFGCSSMGALRAAELHRFGMRGVGNIFEAYRDGIIEDDDEVALLHGPEETGYAQISEPMVNVRATLDAAVGAGVIEAAFAELLCREAKEIFYQNLTWKTLLATGEIQENDPDQCLRFKDWLPSGRVDAKRADAIEMLQAIDDFLAADPKPLSVDYDFEWTHLWDGVVAEAGTGSGIGGAAGDLLDELRLEPETYGRFRREALLRSLAQAESEAHHGQIDPQSLKEAMTRFRMGNGLLRVKDLEAWLTDRQMMLNELEQRVEADLRTDLLMADAGGELAAHVLAALKSAPEYARLSERAVKKRDLLEGHEGPTPRGDEHGLSRLKLRNWYFGTRLRQPIPDDLEAFVEALDLADLDSFYALLAREYTASQITAV